MPLQEGGEGTFVPLGDEALEQLAVGLFVPLRRPAEAANILQDAP
jgi:hypothetical protein